MAILVSKSQPAGSKNIGDETTRGPISPREVITELERHVLLDGFKLVFDPRKSRGSRFVDAATGREWIDLYSFYASQPIGFNHPYFERPNVEDDLLEAAKVKIANSDVCSVQFARFVQTFARVMGLNPLDRYFFIEGGGVAVENALKAAMDWKVRKNLEKGLGEIGTEIIHFEQAFHGRTGYTLSLTNTDPRKTAFYAKFPWPRIISPKLEFSLPRSQRIAAVLEKERLAEKQILEALNQRPDQIAAIIIEPIQGEGGDNHFRREFFEKLRQICDDHDLLLIFDEVQTGMGLTGRNWCCENFGVLPDLLVFGKKAQVCGVMAGPRLDEVKDNVFRLPSRINSTWGGNYTDAVRSTHFLRIIEEERLVENARVKGEFFLSELQALSKRRSVISAVRGLGLMLAFSLPDTQTRDAFWKGAFELGLLVIRCGQKSIRVRPVLDVTEEVIEEALRIMDKQCSRL